MRALPRRLRGGEMSRCRIGLTELPRELLGGLGEQRTDGVFRFVVLAFTEVGVPHVSTVVDQVLGGPVSVRVRVPGAVVVVEGDRVGDVEAVDRPADVRGNVLERELRCMDTHHHEA